VRAARRPLDAAPYLAYLAYLRQKYAASNS
jgi:hypothetical protein